MKRHLFTLLLCLGLAPAVPAALPRQPSPVVPPVVPRADRESSPEPQRRLVVTAATAVRLNGRPCPFAAVPSDAVIEHVELAADEQTILTIDFRTRHPAAPGHAR